MAGFNYKGIFTRDRRPKLAAHRVRALWRGEVGRDVFEALTQAFDVIRRTIPKMGADRPAIGRSDFKYARCHDSHWVDGFWSGQLWLAYAETGDRTFLEAARAQRPYFIQRLDRPETHDHDLGFLYILSLVADTKLTGDEVACRGALRAADSLAGRYNPRGRFIPAWNWRSESDPNRGRIIIGCMENLNLLFWAAEQTSQTCYRDIAVAHAHHDRYDCARRWLHLSLVHIRSDTGERCGAKRCRYADESCWSRGRRRIHGFAMAYCYTGDEQFRATAVRLAGMRWLTCRTITCPTGITGCRTMRRTTATRRRARSAAGLFLLADVLDDASQADRYRAAACAILDALIAGYALFDHPEAEGLLAQGASHVAEGLADNMLPYGDYFFLEALLRAQGRTAFFW